MTYTYELISDLTIISSYSQEEIYIKMQGIPSTSIISVHILDIGAKCIIQSSIDSTEYFHQASSHSEMLWENIKINGNYLTEVDTNILSSRFASSNFLYIKNTSSSDLRIKISLRGNR